MCIYSLFDFYYCFSYFFCLIVLIMCVLEVSVISVFNTFCNLLLQHFFFLLYEFPHLSYFLYYEVLVNFLSCLVNLYVWMSSINISPLLLYKHKGQKIYLQMLLHLEPSNFNVYCIIIEY